MHQSDNPPVALLADAFARLSPARQVPLALLRTADSPRVAGPDETHARQLAEAGAPFQPIIVHEPTMRVIDGIHRLRAAMLRGAATIAARYFDGSEPDAFVLAVAANAGHGLPLSLTDRTRAAARILASHAQWSDRAIAGITGLAPGTVANLRRRTADQDPTKPATTARIGRDGRVRPLDGAAGRRRAAEVIEEFPEASLREIAARAGISVGTARDVRERIHRGEDAVLRSPRRGPADEAPRLHTTTDGPPIHAIGAAEGRSVRSVTVAEGQPIHGVSTAHGTSLRGVAAPADGPSSRGVGAAAPDRRSPSARVPTAPDQSELLRSLCRDPSFRHNESGRLLLRMLETHAVGMAQRERIIDSLPAHWVDSVSAAAMSCAEEWRRFAARIEELTCVA